VDSNRNFRGDLPCRECDGTGWASYRSETLGGGFEESYRLCPEGHAPRYCMVSYWSLHCRLNLKAWLPDATEDDVSLVSQTLLGLAQLYTQFRKAPAADVLEFHVLQVLPDSLIGVEIGSVARKPLQLKPILRLAGEELFDRSTAMDRRTIPDDE
jgi:hypothetical protein